MPENTMNTKRKTGREWKAAAWALHHPILTTAATGLGIAAATAPEMTGAALVAGVAGTVTWARVHPESYDRYAAPRVRDARRRWLSWNYMGLGWRRNMRECGLSRSHPGNGDILIPRVLKVQVHSRHVETIFVKLLKGQTHKQWTDALDALAVAFNAERVAIEKVKPQVVALIVQRTEPFTCTIDLPPLPQTESEVDLGSVFLGIDEYGAAWCESVLGNHFLVVGASRSGKNSITWAALWGLAPLIRSGVVRVWMCDPKQTELAMGKGLAYRYGSGVAESAEVVKEFLEDQQAMQKRLQEAGLRKFTPSVETPLNILVADEIGAMLAYGSGAADDRTSIRTIRSGMDLIGSQGLATGHAMWGFVQEPTKDVVSCRELFTLRVCLRTTSAAHADMALGDEMRRRGAIADEIPNIPETAGIGFKVAERTRTPIRVRAAYATDEDIRALVEYVTAGRDAESAPHLRLVPDAA
ncbi:FtsK/SpoIIIE domain-containing protein [Glycomyces artemisiae]|uniref:S-DNA-T family DNA segregation ATPase FtsK/SpoIIIE n=1 Tax=Glycomyces artemisiae TaxID=1076443 RepID=A0A2T0UXA5_9ACTN|nr:FtsK/SpoIIIE domain-containing protein [Glycomyces artemisiae]PRY62560.1 S-DNA-T family DNA segregation ATPase FtsK/SpoIIIE [Glycomyces artemisiae]